jgi:hypothetical protein
MNLIMLFVAVAAGIVFYSVRCRKPFWYGSPAAGALTKEAISTLPPPASTTRPAHPPARWWHPVWSWSHCGG